MRERAWDEVWVRYLHAFFQVQVEWTSEASIVFQDFEASPFLTTV